MIWLTFHFDYWLFKNLHFVHFFQFEESIFFPLLPFGASGVEIFALIRISCKVQFLASTMWTIGVVADFLPRVLVVAFYVIRQRSFVWKIEAIKCAFVGKVVTEVLIYWRKELVGYRLLFVLRSDRDPFLRALVVWKSLRVRAFIWTRIWLHRSARPVSRRSLARWHLRVGRVDCKLNFSIGPLSSKVFVASV